MRLSNRFVVYPIALSIAIGLSVSILAKGPSAQDHPGPSLKEKSLKSVYFEHLPGMGASGIFVVDQLAYITTPLGLKIYDISSISHPEEIASYRITSASDVKIIGPYAYLARGKMNSQTGFFTILDVSDPKNIKKLGDLRLPHGSISIEIKDHYAFIGGFDSGLFVVDFSNKENPELIQTVKFPRIRNPKTAEFPILTRLICKSKGNHFPCLLGRTWWNHLEGNLLYVNDENTGLHILNIEDPSNPRELSQFIYPFWPGENNLSKDAFNDIALEGPIGYVALDNGGMLVVDLSDPEKPLLLSHYNPWKGYTWDKSPGHIAQVTVKNKIAYATSGEEGVYVLDVSNPKMPYLKHKHPLSEQLGASWGIFLKDNYLFVTYIGVDPGSNTKGLKGGWEIFQINSL